MSDNDAKEQAVEAKEFNASSSIDATEIESPSSTEVKGTWRTRLREARIATSIVLQQAKQAGELGRARAQQRKLSLHRQASKELETGGLEVDAAAEADIQLVHSASNDLASVDVNVNASSGDDMARLTGGGEASHVKSDQPQDLVLSASASVDQNDLTPISSCDTWQPPDLTTPNTSELKMTQNFSKLFNNAKKVDQIRHAKKAADPRKRGVTDPNATTKDVLSEEEQNTMSVEDAQQRLIDQMKLGLNYLTTENKYLKEHRDSAQSELQTNATNYKANLNRLQKEVEERNLRLAVLEQHFVALNDRGDNQDSVGSNSTNANRTANANEKNIASTLDNDATAADGPSSSVSATHNSNNTSSNENDYENAISPAITSTLSSIVQLDKSYYKELTTTVDENKIIIENLEQENKELTQKVEDTTEEMEKKERTIISLDQSLKQMREARFMNKKPKKTKSKQHKRRNTESVFTTISTTTSATMPNQSMDDDDFSVSVASSCKGGVSESETADGKDDDSNGNNKKKNEEAIAKAVADALSELEIDHRSTMDVLSKQLELKEKIINRLEAKVYSMLRNAKEVHASPTRQVSPDVVARNIGVTNELMDASIRRLQNMMTQLEIVEKERRTDLADEIAPIRRVGTKVSLVHEELKVAIKLIEQKLQNNVESIRQMGKGEGASDVCSGQTSGEDEDGGTSSASEQASQPQASFEDRISEVLATATKSLKETEVSIRREIDDLKDQLEKVEFEMAGKQDTIEALELACAEHVDYRRSLQEEIEELTSSET